MTLQRAVFILLALTLALAGVAMLLEIIDPSLTWYSHYGLLSVALFGAISLLSIWIVSRSMRTDRPTRFVSAVMVTFAIRLLASLIVVLVVFVVSSPDPLTFIAPFGTAYLLFTAVETWLAIKLSKKGAGH